MGCVNCKKDYIILDISSSSELYLHHSVHKTDNLIKSKNKVKPIHEYKTFKRHISIKKKCESCENLYFEDICPNPTCFIIIKSKNIDNQNNIMDIHIDKE